MPLHQIDPMQIREPEDDGRPLDTLSAVWTTILHRRWWVLLTASAVILTGVATLARIPNRYTSEATIVITRQQVPERYVVPTSTTDLIKDLETMQGEVLSRTRLLSLIDEFGLYSKERKRSAPEQLLELVRSDIQVEPLAPAAAGKEADSFKLSFTAENPTVAQEVTSRLASLFILNNVKGREDQAVSTTKFLNDQLASAQERLSDLEQNLRDFKMQHLGELPEQQQGNLAILAGLQGQLQNTTSAIAQAEQQRAYLESLINTLRGLARRDSGVTKSDPPIDPQLDSGISGAEARLAYLENERKTLLGFRPPYDPEVAKLDDYIARTKALLQKLKTNRPEAERAAEPDDASIAQLRGQLESNRVQVQNLTKDQDRLKQAIEQYQNRLNQTPVREQQLAGLLQDIELGKQHYADLLAKEQQSQLATTLEKQQGGQQFRLLEPPSLPTLPSSPKRMKLGLGAGAAGLALGFLTAFWAEFKSRAFYTEKEVSQCCPLPLVVGLPLFWTPAEQRKYSRLRVCEWIVGSALTVFVAAVEVLYLSGSDMVRNAAYLKFFGGIQ